MNFSTASRAIYLVIGTFFVGGIACGITASSFLVNPGIYEAEASSEFSDFGDFSVSKLFDDEGDVESTWAIDGFAGNNPQGRDEGWVAATFNKTYLIDQLRFAARKPSGQTDGIDVAKFWLSTSPFNVDVTSASATDLFLTTPKGKSPQLEIGPFLSADEIDYSLGSEISARYLLAQFLNTTDSNNNRNFGARTLEIGVTGVIPEPSTAFLTAMAACGVLVRRRRLA